MPNPWRHSRPDWMWLWQPDLVVGDPAHSRDMKLDDHCGPFQPRLFYGSMRLCILNLCYSFLGSLHS